MSIQVKKSKRPRTRPRPKTHPDLLQTTIALCLKWFYLQGAIYLLCFDRLAYWLRLRWDGNSIPLVRSQGVLLLALAFFLSKALKNPQKQYSTIDTLLIVLLGQAVITFSAIGHGMYSFSDWVTLAINLTLAGSLIRFRVKVSQRESLPEPTAPHEPVALSSGSFSPLPASPPLTPSSNLPPLPASPPLTPSSNLPPLPASPPLTPSSNLPPLPTSPSLTPFSNLPPLPAPPPLTPSSKKIQSEKKKIYLSKSPPIPLPPQKKIYKN